MPIKVWSRQRKFAEECDAMNKKTRRMAASRESITKEPLFCPPHSAALLPSPVVVKITQRAGGGRRRSQGHPLQEAMILQKEHFYISTVFFKPCGQENSFWQMTERFCTRTTSELLAELKVENNRSVIWFLLQACEKHSRNVITLVNTVYPGTDNQQKTKTSFVVWGQQMRLTNLTSYKPKVTSWNVSTKTKSARVRCIKDKRSVCHFGLKI